MATTTNYSWTTPDDTDLVKDGAAAIRTLGSSVDTTTKALNPSTTLGDVEYRSSTANTNTRLGIGTTGQVLTVAGGVPSWATPASGGMTLLSTTTLSGYSTTISSISGSYNDLVAVAFGITSDTADGDFFVEPNGNNTLNTWVAIDSNGTTRGGAQRFKICRNKPLRTSSANAYSITFTNYASTTSVKHIFASYGHVDTGNTTMGGISTGFLNSTSAITSLVFLNDAGQFTAGTVLLYGVK
jgi:hypothetical protein